MVFNTKKLLIQLKEVGCTRKDMLFYDIYEFNLWKAVKVLL